MAFGFVPASDIPWTLPTATVLYSLVESSQLDWKWTIVESFQAQGFSFPLCATSPSNTGWREAGLLSVSNRDPTDRPYHYVVSKRQIAKSFSHAAATALWY
jgi:hypothetical protein